MMHPLLTTLLRRWFTAPSASLASAWPNLLTLSIMRWMYQIQIGPEQLQAIVKAVRSHQSCRFLVFGVGHDSPFWAYMNRTGMTVFIEDHPEWYKEVTAAHPELDVCLVNYETKLSQWKDLIGHPEQLWMPFPPIVEQAGWWHVILVDAPAGRGPEFPGSMKSIFAANRLVKQGGDVFVHDTEREVEHEFCNRYLAPHHFIREIRQPEGWLRQYRVEW